METRGLFFCADLSSSTMEVYKMKKVYILDKDVVDYALRYRQIALKVSIQSYLFWRWNAYEKTTAFEYESGLMSRVWNIQDSRNQLRSFYDIFGKEG